MNHNTSRGLVATLRNSYKATAARIGAVAALGFAAAPAAFAQTSGLASAVTANVDTAELIAIGVIVMGIAGIVLMVRSGKSTAR